MGEGQSKRSLFLVANSESDAQPGTRCITTSSFVDCEPPTTLEQIFQEAWIFRRYPISNPATEAMLKHVECEEYGPNERTVKVVLDGQKLDAAGRGRGDGIDKVVFWSKSIWVSVEVGGQTQLTMSVLHFVDPAAGAWADEASDAEEIGMTTFYGLRNPDRIEFCIDVNGERDASEIRLQRFYNNVDAIWKSWLVARAAKVQVTHCVKSIKQKGCQSNVSDTMDEHIEYSDLFDAMVAVLRATVGRSKLEDGDAGFGGVAVRPRVHKLPIRAEVTVSKDSGEIRIFEVAVEEDGSVAWPAWSRLTYCVVHQGPLRAESWEEDESGAHVSNLLGARSLQEWIQASMDKATSFGSLLGM